MGASVFRPQVPQYSQLAQAKAQTIGNIFSTAIPAAAESVRLYMSNRDKNKIFDAYRQTILNPKNMEEMGLDEAKAQAFAGRLKPRAGESVEDYEKRVSPVMWNIKYWDQAGREAGVPLDDPFISSALFKGTVDDALERIGAERVRAGQESGQIKTREQAVAALPNVTGSQIAQTLPTEQEEKQRQQDVEDREYEMLTREFDTANKTRNAGSLQGIITKVELKAEKLAEELKIVNKIRKDIMKANDAPSGQLSPKVFPEASKYGITSVEDADKKILELRQGIQRAMDQKKVWESTMTEMIKTQKDYLETRTAGREKSPEDKEAQFARSFLSVLAKAYPNELVQTGTDPFTGEPKYRVLPNTRASALLADPVALAKFASSHPLLRQQASAAGVTALPSFSGMIETAAPQQKFYKTMQEAEAAMKSKALQPGEKIFVADAGEVTVPTEQQGAGFQFAGAPSQRDTGGNLPWQQLGETGLKIRPPEAQQQPPGTTAKEIVAQGTTPEEAEEDAIKKGAKPGDIIIWNGRRAVLE